MPRINSPPDRTHHRTVRPPHSVKQTILGKARIPGWPVRDETTDLETDERPKKIAGRYVVDRLIARGGMAAVYLATHVDLNRDIALKILRPPEDVDEVVGFEERFRLEAQTLASLSHANIVTLHDFGELPDGRCFLAMEYIEGPRLSDLMRGGPLAPERAAGLILQVCQALRYAHRKGVIHRDLKPSNLLVRTLDDGSEQMQVVDFGLVKLTDSEQDLTRAGLVLGSPHCMSPEQVRGQDVDYTADIYAIGILLFRALTGRYPFHGSNPAATMMAHINTPPPSFFSVAPDLTCPEGLEEVVRRCLEKEPSDRYASMDELIMELVRVFDLPSEAFRTSSIVTSTLTPPDAPVAPQPDQAPPDVRWALVAAGVLAFLGLGALAWLGQSPRDTRSEAVAVDLPREAIEIPAPVAVPPAPEVIIAPVALEEPAPAAAPAPKTTPIATPVAQRKPKPKPAAVRARPRKPAPVSTPVPTVPKPAVETPKDAPDGYKDLPDDW